MKDATDIRRIIKSYLPNDYILGSEEKEKKEQWLEDNFTFLGIDDGNEYYHLDHDVVIPDHVSSNKIILIKSPGVTILTKQGRIVCNIGIKDYRKYGNNTDIRFAYIIEGVK